MFAFKGAFAKDPALKRVTIVALGIGASGILGMLYVRRKTINTIENQPYFKATLDIFNGYDHGVSLLGPPLKQFSHRSFMDRRMNFLYADGQKAKLTIPMQGQLKGGMVHSFSSKSDQDEKWTVDKVDMQLDGMMWTFYLHPDKVHEYKLTENMTIEDYEKEINIEDCYPIGVDIKAYKASLLSKTMDLNSKQNEKNDSKSKESEMKDSDSKHTNSTKSNSEKEEGKMKYI